MTRTSHTLTLVIVLILLLSPAFAQTIGDSGGVGVVAKYSIPNDVHVLLLKNWSNPGTGQRCYWNDEAGVEYAYQTTDAQKPMLTVIGGNSVLCFPTNTRMTWSNWTVSQDVSSYTFIFAEAFELPASAYIGFEGYGGANYRCLRGYVNGNDWTIETGGFWASVTQMPTNGGYGLTSSQRPASGSTFFAWSTRDNNGANGGASLIIRKDDNSLIVGTASETTSPVLSTGIGYQGAGMLSWFRSIAVCNRKLSPAEIQNVVIYMKENQ